MYYGMKHAPSAGLITQPVTCSPMHYHYATVAPNKENLVIIQGTRRLPTTPDTSSTGHVHDTRHFSQGHWNKWYLGGKSKRKIVLYTDRQKPRYYHAADGQHLFLLWTHFTDELV